jgi:RyR domain/TrkA-N domain
MSNERVTGPGRLPWPARIVFTVVAMVAFVLGVVGFEQLLQEGSSYLQPRATYAHDEFDLFYYSLQLFVLEAAPLQSARKLPPALEIARFAAPAVTISLIFLAIQALLAQRWNQARIRLTRGHSILCGPQDTVRQLAEQIHRETGGKTVVVASGRPTLGRRHLYVVGDPRQRQVLERARVDRAREVIVVGPDSVLNAEVAIAVHAVNREKRTAVTCYAEAPDAELFQAVVGQEVSPGEVNRLESFSRHERTARALLDQLPPWPPSDPRSAVLVIGYGSLGRVLVDRLVQFWSGGTASSGEPIPRLCVLDPDVLVEVFERQHADAKGRMTVTARRSDPSWLTTIDDLLVPAADGTQTVPGRVYVCLDDDAAGIAVGDTALRLLAGEETTIVVAVPRSSVLGQAAVGTDLDKEASTRRPGDEPSRPTAIRTIKAARLVLISVMRTVYSIAAMRTGMNEQLAMAIHETYRRHAMDQGASVEINDSVRPWDELPDPLKDSNREQAWDIGRKLAMVGLSAIPGGGSSGGGVTLTEGDVEKLARAEHRRWMNERIAKGWRHGEVRDNDRKLHPDLVEWEYLSEYSRDKDRSAVRAIPEHLAAAGLQLIRTK